MTTPGFGWGSFRGLTPNIYPFVPNCIAGIPRVHPHNPRGGGALWERREPAPRFRPQLKGLAVDNLRTSDIPFEEIENGALILLILRACKTCFASRAESPEDARSSMKDGRIGEGCGQDDADLLKYSQAVFDSDPERNVMFALHLYGGTNDYSASIQGVDTGGTTLVRLQGHSPTHPFAPSFDGRNNSYSGISAYQISDVRVMARRVSWPDARLQRELFSPESCATGSGAARSTWIHRSRPRPHPQHVRSSGS